MGKQAAEVGYQEGSTVVRVAALPDGPRVAAGLDDGRVWTAALAGTGVDMVKAEKGAPITTLAFSPDDRRLAWGDESGGAGLAELKPATGER